MSRNDRNSNTASSGQPIRPGSSGWSGWAIVALVLLVVWGVDHLSLDSFKDKDTKAAPSVSSPSGTYQPSMLPAHLPCQPPMSVSRLSTDTVHPGETFEMYGRWGAPARNKVPVINKGKRNDLEVVAWTADTLTLRVPAGLPAGRYKTGVYCFPEPPEKAWYSSGFKSIRVLEAAFTP